MGGKLGGRDHAAHLALGALGNTGLAAGAGLTLRAPLDLLPADQAADVFGRFAGVDAGDDLGAGHAEPGFCLVSTIDPPDLRRVLGADDDGDALGAAELEEGRK